MSSVYGQKAAQLVRDLKASKWLPKYDDALVREVVAECSTVFRELRVRVQTLERLQNERGGEIEDEEDDMISSGMLLYHESLLRNKRVLLAHELARLEKLQELIFRVGLEIPPQQKGLLSDPEMQYAKDYQAALAKYQGSVGNLDLAADMVYPRSVHVRVRALEDGGEILTTDSGVVRFQQGKELYMRRTDADKFIRTGKLEYVSA